MSFSESLQLPTLHETRNISVYKELNKQKNKQLQG